MTVILTCLTNEYVVQASDRQLSTIDEKGRVRPTRQDSNKALIYENQFSFAYTGLADLPKLKSGQTAVDWASERLKEGKSLDEVVDQLRYRITELMNTNQVRKLPAYKRRLAFVGAGFKESVSGGKVIRSPLYLLIENFIQDDGSYLDEPRDAFRVVKKWLYRGRGVAALYVAGQRLDDDGTRERALARACMRCVQHHVKPEEIGVLLIQEIQAMAAKENSAVGKHSMCTFVPRAYAEFSAENHLVHIGTIPMENPLTSATPGVLEPTARASLRERIVILGKFDAPRSFYIDGDGGALPSYSPLYVAPNQIVPSIITSDMSITHPPIVSYRPLSNEG